MAEISPEVDRNMVAGQVDENGLVWFDVTNVPFDLYGFYATNPFKRLPEDVAEATNPGVKRNNFHTAGGRVRFSTNSTRISVRVTMPYVTKFVHMPITGSSSFDLYIDTEYGSKYRGCYKPEVTITDGFTGLIKVPKTDKAIYYTINFPLYSPVSKLEIGLDAGSVLGHGMKYLPILPIVYYGSSITQGACASRPGLCYEAIISRRLNVDHVNLGFSGNARAEEPIINYMKTMKMSCFVSDYDHNAPNADYLLETHYRMYETIRAEQPDLPYIMVSRPDFIFSPTESVKRRRIVEDSFRKARENGDKNVYYIDGDGICRGADEDSCSVDGTHPNDIGFMKMADSIGRTIRRAMRKGFAADNGEE